MQTSLTDRLGLTVPIVLAPIGGAHSPALAAAVSNAGGLGTLPLWGADLDSLRRQIRETQALTTKPFAVNLNLNLPQEARLAASLEEGVRIISFFWQDPTAIIPIAKQAGAVVMHTVASADEARRAIDAGADILVAQGWEAGGHVRGTVSTMALVPAVVDAAGKTPVVAAGGIADGRGLAAALALGAAGAWIGTRFLAAHEAVVHPEYLARLIAASESDTIWLENLFDIGWPDAPHRVLRNSTVIDWENSGRPPSGSRPGTGDIITTSPTRGPVLRYRAYTPGPDTTGNIEALSMWAGQGVGLVRRSQPAAEIVAEIVREAEAILGRLRHSVAV